MDPPDLMRSVDAALAAPEVVRRLWLHEIEDVDWRVPDGIEQLTWLEEQGVGAVLSMTETPLATDILAQHTLTVLHLPVPDMTPPTTGQLIRALEFIDEQHTLGKAVVVHCLMGQGRTGTVLAAYLIRGGASAAEALRTVRGVCAGAVGSPAQERALSTFAERRDWIV